MKNGGNEISVHQLSILLYNLDPLNTCCKENNCHDEYDQVASWTSEAMAEGKDLNTALHQTITELFCKDAAENIDYLIIEEKLFIV